MNAAISAFTQKAVPINAQVIANVLKPHPDDQQPLESFAPAYDLSQFDPTAGPELEKETRWAARTVRCVRDHAVQAQDLDQKDGVDVDGRPLSVRTAQSRLDSEVPVLSFESQPGGVGKFSYTRASAGSGYEEYQSRTVYDEKNEPEFHIFRSAFRRDPNVINSGVTETVVLAADNSAAWYLSEH